LQGVGDSVGDDDIVVWVGEKVIFVVWLQLFWSVIDVNLSTQSHGHSGVTTGAIYSRKLMLFAFCVYNFLALKKTMSVFKTIIFANSLDDWSDFKHLWEKTLSLEVFVLH